MYKKLLFLTIMSLTYSLCCAINKDTVSSPKSIAIDKLLYKITSSSERTVSISGNRKECSGNIIIPSTVVIDNVNYTVTSIENNAFSGCSSMTSITIPNSVTSIGSSAFFDCTLLRYVVMPDSITSISSYTFMNCRWLTTINIPNSVTSIGRDAFYGCDKQLISVTIPKSVTSIGFEAFGGCRSLKEIKVEPNNQSFSEINGVLYNKDMTTLVAFPGGKTSVDIPNSVTSIRNGAFAGSNLTSIVIPNSVTSIGSAAFFECINLKSVIIPNTISSIGSETFSCCTSLIEVTIPCTITLIGSEAFCNCYELASVYYMATEPIQANYDCFLNSYPKATLYVPAEAVEKCKQINPWKNFLKIEVYDLGGIEEISLDFDSAEPYEVFDYNGILLNNTIDNLTHGLYIIRQGNVVKKVTVK